MKIPPFSKIPGDLNAEKNQRMFSIKGIRGRPTFPLQNPSEGTFIGLEGLKE